MLAEVRRLQREPVSSERLQETRNDYVTAYWMGQETNLGQATQLGTYELTGGGWRNALALVDKVQRGDAGRHPAGRDALLQERALRRRRRSEESRSSAVPVALIADTLQAARTGSARRPRSITPPPSTRSPS